MSPALSLVHSACLGLNKLSTFSPQLRGLSGFAGFFVPVTYNLETLSRQSCLVFKTLPIVLKIIFYVVCLSEFLMAVSGKRVNPDPVTQLWLKSV